MKKEKWLLNEIDDWKRESIISEETAVTLMHLYAPKKNTKFLIVLFSIIGALLIGTGVILIGAKNWYDLPMFMRVAIAFLPLIITQALAVFTLKFKYESVAWREAVAILVTASVFTVVAMVGQIFHFSDDFGIYVLKCGLLSLPMIFILDAASPLLIYYWTILNWALLYERPINALILFVLFSIGALFLVLKRKQGNGRLTYMTWITVLAGFVVALSMGILLEGSLLLAVLSYFVLLLSVEDLPEKLIAPFKIIGTVGALITLAILTYRDMWLYFKDSITAGSTIMLVVMLIATSFFAIKAFKRDKLKFAFVVTLLVVCIMRYIWGTASLDKWPYEFILVIISNVILLFVGIGFIAHGTKNINLLTTNIGMATTCALILMRFFDSDMDFLWRGIVFLVLGIAFLLVNLRILRINKRNGQEV